MANKPFALDAIEKTWKSNFPLGEKIKAISSEYSAAGLDLESAAMRIKASNSEFEALLTLSNQSDEILDLLSRVNPPKNLWLILACANEEELKFALRTIMEGSDAHKQISTKSFYDLIVTKDGPTEAQRLEKLDPSVIKYFAEKGDKYWILNEKEYGFMSKNVTYSLKHNRPLSERQMKWFRDILKKLVQNRVISTNSQDGDQEQCNMVLKALD